MDNRTSSSLEQLALDFDRSRPRLRHIALLRMNRSLLKIIDIDDILQETWSAVVRRMEHFQKAETIPLFVRFRTMLLQTIIDMERKYLLCQKRNIGKSVPLEPEDPDQTEVQQHWNHLVDTITSPCTRLAEQERHALLRDLLGQLPESDRIIIEMRHFEALSNKECAAALGIEEKNASIRYVRALRRFQQTLLEHTEFRS